MNLKKVVWLTSFQKPPMQSVSVRSYKVRPFVPPLVFSVTFLLSCFEQLLVLCFTWFDGSTHCLNFDKFRSTPPLIVAINQNAISVLDGSNYSQLSPYGHADNTDSR